MAIKIGTEIVIDDDKIFKIGDGDPEHPLNGMIRYNKENNDFEFYIGYEWVSSGININPLYTMIRYNSDIPDFEFWIKEEWVRRNDCPPCETPIACDPCPTPDCPEEEECPDCSDYIMGLSHRTRHFLLYEENRWSNFAAGGTGETYDTWDVSKAPIGSTFDFKFHTHIIPDRFIVEYPMGFIVYDSGWRSTDPTHENINHLLYETPVTYPGEDRIFNICTKTSQTKMRVIVFGTKGDHSTEWMYAVRYKTDNAHIPIIHPKSFDDG